jgi:hypothetical protein
MADIRTNSDSLANDTFLCRSRVSSKIISQEELDKIVNISLTNFLHRGVVTIHIALNSENGGSFMKMMKLTISETDNVERVIKLAIRMFNRHFEMEKIAIQLRENSELYTLKPSKKNGMPKDLPCMCLFM